MHRAKGTHVPAQHSRYQAAVPALCYGAVLQRGHRRRRPREQHPPHPLHHSHHSLRPQHVRLSRWELSSSVFWDSKHFLILFRTRATSREEKNLQSFLEQPCEKWVETSYEVDGRTTSPYWPCTSCHPSAGGLLVLTSFVGCWSLHMPARSHQGVLTSKGTKHDCACVRAWTLKSLYKHVLYFTCWGCLFLVLASVCAYSNCRCWL